MTPQAVHVCIEYMYVESTIQMMFFAILNLLGCRESYDDDTSSEKRKRIYVINEITFARQTEAGVWGFDIFQSSPVCEP